MTSLITAGVDVNVKNLVRHAYNMKLTTKSQSLNTHTSVITQWPGNCAITSAARYGMTKAVSLLLAAGANIDLQNKVK